MKRKFLVTGGFSKIGQAIQNLRPNWYYPTHQELDITNIGSIRRYVRDEIPSEDRLGGFLHMAGMGCRMACEIDKKQAYLTNSIGTLFMVKTSKFYPYPTKFVYLSTPNVFSYEPKMPYSEMSMPNPVNQLGFTKAYGEAMVRVLDWWSIIRPSFYLPPQKLAEHIVDICSGDDEEGVYHLCSVDDPILTSTRMKPIV